MDIKDFITELQGSHDPRIHTVRADVAHNAGIYFFLRTVGRQSRQLREPDTQSLFAELAQVRKSLVGDATAEASKAGPRDVKRCKICRVKSRSRLLSTRGPAATSSSTAWLVPAYRCAGDEADKLLMGKFCREPS